MSNDDLPWIVNYIWGIANDVLRDLYVRGKYRDVILPMIVLRRLDAVLEDSKQNVLDMKAVLDQADVVEQDTALRAAAAQAFYNTSPFTLRDLRTRTSQHRIEADFPGLPRRVLAQRPGHPRELRVPQPDSAALEGRRPRHADREAPLREQQTRDPARTPPAEPRGKPQAEDWEMTMMRSACSACTPLTMMLMLTAGTAFGQTEAEPPDDGNPLEGGGRYDCELLWSQSGDVVQLNCTADGSDLDVPEDFAVQKIGRMPSRYRNGDMLLLETRAIRFGPGDDYHVDIVFTGTDGSTWGCDVWHYDIKTIGEVDAHSVSPSWCGKDAQWQAVDIRAQSRAHDCLGCGLFRRTEIPVPETVNIAAMGEKSRRTLAEHLNGR